MSQNLTSRLARSSDFREIVKLSEGIYNGHDYLPLRFHTWMKMKNLAVILAFSGEKLACLSVCSVVDEGRTIVLRAGRTLPEFRDRGVSNQLLLAIRHFVRETFPSVMRERFTSGWASFPGCMKVAEQDILSCYVEKATLRSQQIPPINSVEIQSRTKEQLSDVIFSRPVAQKLFPDNVIIAEHFPIEPLRSNIDYLMQENNLYFAVEKYTDDASQASPRSVSFGVLSPRVKIMHWSATVYSCDPVLYEAHLAHQFKRACEDIKDAFIFSCFQDKRFTNYGRRVLKDILHMKLDEERSKESVYLYERSFPVQQSHI